jgi:hypothetical protein
MIKERKNEIRAQQIHNIELQSRCKHQPSLLLHLEPALGKKCREARREIKRCFGHCRMNRRGRRKKGREEKVSRPRHDDG